ncbi:trimethylamine methyltransferase family protein [Candidatus Contubernalis alkaliaceticus]|uniref:trimethylamine methyltransferase family protein n=1 Tax=Candidatus Contubernalis alkaliaceticus TaxID=338645 RepID=UPI001F4BEB46|nr:trimethylamine methyltransferase family protein [Candidatus Contubernalis alkalaceticus]UNC90739.1 trimethylamine methyltransferase family protein [Candidatus Contubernalis alkalaceticus]
MNTRIHQYKPLTQRDIEEVHRATMEVLSETGFEVHQPEAFAYFKEVADFVDEQNQIIKLKEKTIRELISSVPSTVTLYGREEKHDCRLGSGEVYFGTGGTALNMLDYGEKESRTACMQDLENVIRIVHRMDNIDICLLPTYPSELDISEVDVHRFNAGLTYTNKHIMGGVYTSQGIDDVIRMAEEAAGSPEALRERPFISIITCGISPLRVDNEYGTFMIQVAKEGIPLAVPVEPLCGGTSPMSLAGTLVIQNCDALINVMLTQLVNPGTPVIYGCVASSMDMRSMSYLGAPVESGLINAATAQMTHYYGIPYYSTAGISDSKTLDAQCGYESAITNMLVGLAGADFIHDAAGLMEFAFTVSLEKLVIDNEIIGMVKQAIKGIDVSEETLCLDEIKETGPGGNFLTSRSTRKFMRSEHYQPTLSDRQERSLWISEGHMTADQRAHEIVTGILKEKPKRYLLVKEKLKK